MTAAADQASPLAASDNALVLAVTSSPTEVRLLEDWVAERRRTSGAANIAILHLPAGDPEFNIVARLIAELDVDDDRAVIPVRVFWMPRENTSNRWKFAGLLAGRDPYRPSHRRQRRILRKQPTRARVVTGEPASVARLRVEWQRTGGTEEGREFARFVIRRAVLAVERIEYRLLGPEYKSPRLVKPEMLASARFRKGLDDIPGATVEEAGRLLDEMAAGWSRLSIDLLPAFYRKVIERGFDPQLDIETAQVETMRDALARHPAVMLFSHRSNLDGAVLAVALRENRLPRAHVFGGINMAFSFMGPLLRRSGVIFIRRKAGDDPLYKYVLKEYVGYLAEKRFNLSWSIEGTRSRTGKMLPPKLGLLSYVATAYLEGRSEDILLQPVSISFDQLHEIVEYAEYARGGVKKPEGLGWLYRIIKAQGERNFGKIYVRFPEPVSMRQYLGETDATAAADESIKRLALQRMAIEVAWRTQNVTPINATSLISALLLATRGIALTLSQIHHTLGSVLQYLESKQIPMTESARHLTTMAGVRAALDALSDGHPVTRVDDGWQPVWRIAPEHEHAAAFYRNSAIHAFLETSIVELALVHASHAGGDRLDAFWAQAQRLRDLLKFDFYFPSSAEFRSNVVEEMSWHDDWEQAVRADDALSSVLFDGIEAMLIVKRPLMSWSMLRPFFEAYEIVADVLCKAPPALAEDDLIRRALGVGRQYVAQGRIRSNEPVSALVFATARQVAANQGLFDQDSTLPARRAAFRDELRSILSDIDHVEQLARKQFTAREAALHQREESRP